jgi:hypothetical protein
MGATYLWCMWKGNSTSLGWCASPARPRTFSGRWMEALNSHCFQNGGLCINFCCCHHTTARGCCQSSRMLIILDINCCLLIDAMHFACDCPGHLPVRSVLSLCLAAQCFCRSALVETLGLCMLEVVCVVSMSKCRDVKGCACQLDADTSQPSLHSNAVWHTERTSLRI